MRDGGARCSKIIAVERLRRRSEFRAAATGVRASANGFVVQARRRADDGVPRVGFTVSKRVGNAVERNRVRRRLREIVRLSFAAEGAVLRPGHDYVLIGRRAALSAPFADILGELGTALGRIHRTAGGGTGGGRKPALHEAGSPSKPPKQRRTPSQKSRQQPSAEPSQELPESPPQALCKSFE